MQSTAKKFHGACLGGGAFCKEGTGLLKASVSKRKVEKTPKTKEVGVR